MAYKFPPIPDFSNPSLILNSLREVGKFFQGSLQGLQRPDQPEGAGLGTLAIPDEAYRSAKEVLHRLATYLQRKSTEAEKDHLGGIIAADPDCIDSLYEGILVPFCQDLSSSTGTPREITSAHRLAVIRLLQVCLMEWTPNQGMKEKLVKSGCVSMLFTELRNLTTAIHLSANQFAQHLVLTAAFVVSNCLSDGVDQYMRLHPLTDVEGALTPYFNCPDSSTIQLVCKMTYNQFCYYLHQSKPGSVDCPGDLAAYADLLCAASQSPEFTVRKDNLFLEAAELLKLIRCMCVSDNNRLAIASNVKFHEAIEALLQGGGETEIKCALSLLLSLSADGNLVHSAKEKGKKRRKEESKVITKGVDTKEVLLSTNPKLVLLLKSVQTGQHRGSEEVQELCSAVLWCFERSVPSELDVSSCLAYVKCCYKYGLYEECCHWTDYVRGKCTGVKGAIEPFLLCKAKAMYQSYQQMQVLLRRSEKYTQDLAHLKQGRECVYLEKAREVITILGSLRGSHVFDSESKRFLDIALMDYIRELNKAPDIRVKIAGQRVSVFFCMLCCEKEEIQRSHIIPEAVLRAIYKENDQLFMVGPAGLPSDYHPRTFKTQTFYMLCKKCDNVTLSRDERPFVEEIVKPIYSASPPATQKVDGMPYGEWLYRFCCGVLFRGLALGRGITASTNEEEVYKLFEQCRAVIQSTKTSEVPSEQLPVIAMLFTPGMFREPSPGAHPLTEKSSNLVRALNDTIFFTLSNTALSSAIPSVIRKRHSYVVHFGIFTIVAPFGPIPPECKPFLINPCSGVLNIPANNDRLGVTPPGLQKLYEECTHREVKRYIEKVVEEDREITYGRREVSVMVVKSNSTNLQQAVLQTFNLLPQGFVVDREANKVTTRKGHRILLHHTHHTHPSSSAGHTLLLAAEVAADDGPSRPYVIAHSFIDPPETLQTFGYFVFPHNFAFKGELDQSHKAMMKALRTKDLDLFKAPNILLPRSFARVGLCNYQSLLLHLNRTSTVDRKCISGDGCWYCSSKCDVCMKESSAGFAIQREGVRLQFCGEECKAFLGPPQVFARLHQPAVITPLAQVGFTFLCSDGDGEHISTITTTQLLHLKLPICEVVPTVAVIDVYRVEEGEGLKAGCLFALFHLSNLEEPVFGEFYLTDECKLGKPLPHVDKVYDSDLIKLVDELLQEGLRRSGHEVENIPSLSSRTLTTEKSGAGAVAADVCESDDRKLDTNTKHAESDGAGGGQLETSTAASERTTNPETCHSLDGSGFGLGLLEPSTETDQLIKGDHDTETNHDADGSELGLGLLEPLKESDTELKQSGGDGGGRLGQEKEFAEIDGTDD